MCRGARGTMRGDFQQQGDGSGARQKAGRTHIVSHGDGLRKKTGSSRLGKKRERKAEVKGDGQTPDRQWRCW